MAVWLQASPACFRTTPANVILLTAALGIAACKTPSADQTSGLQSNIPESDPVEYVVMSYDSGGALQETIQEIGANIPDSVKLIYLNPDVTEIEGNIINLKIPRQILTHENARTGSYKGSWESPWVRDYVPEFVRLSDGSFRIVKFKYMYPNSDAVGRFLSKQFTGVDRTEIIELPYAIEGGNLVVDDDRNLFISERAILNNLMPQGAPPQISADSQASEEDSGETADEAAADNPELRMKRIRRALVSVPWSIPKAWKEFDKLRTKMTADLTSNLSLASVTWLPPLNFERGQNTDSTGHLDIFMKYLGRKRMLVGEITVPAGIAATPEGKRLGGQAKQLNGVAKLLQDRGYQVVRIPFVVQASEFSVSLYSYTNSLILGKAAIVPSYHQGLSASDSSHHSPEEIAEDKAFKTADARAREIYKGLGFTVRNVNALSAWGYGGQIHCLTKHIPKLPGVRLKADQN